MVSRIRFDLSVPAEVREDGDHFVSFCPELGVYSQGPGEEVALDNLAEHCSTSSSPVSHAAPWSEC